MLSVVFILCLTANELGGFLQPFLTKKLSALSGIFLIVIGVINLFGPKKEEKNKKNGKIFLESQNSQNQLAIDNISFTL